MGIEIQAMNNGSENIVTVIDFWEEHVSYSQQTATRFHIEEEVKLNFLPCN